MWHREDVIGIINKYNISPGTSFYAYDLSTCLQKIEMLNRCFEGWNLVYSIKANPHSVLLEKFIQHGVGMDAASKNEVLLARGIGCSKENVYFSSPGKTMEDLIKCHDQCILIADSFNEVNRIAKLSKDLKKTFNIGIRVNLPNTRIQGNAFEVMGGQASKFGVSINDLELIYRVCRESNVSIVGLHIYLGSQILDESILIENFIQIANYAMKLSEDLALEFVTFGGGFGVPYIESEKPIDILRIAYNKCLQKKIAFLIQKNIKCNLELGRYIVAESGIFCASVEDVKESFGQKYVILSSGMNAFIRPIFTKEFHKLNSCKELDGELEKVTIVGNLCTPIDQYYEDFLIVKPEIGDWLWFENAGAYGYSMSMLNFISHEQPMEIIIST